MTPTISHFKGEQYGFLSNFHPATVTVPVEMDHVSQEAYGRVELPTVEHGYVVMKSGSWSEFAVDTHLSIAQFRALTPGQAKRTGRMVTLSYNWEQRKSRVMLYLLRQKFNVLVNPGPAERLARTGDMRLVEGNHWHDSFWGVCRCPACGGRGVNQLGKLLMFVRKENAGEATAADHENLWTEAKDTTLPVY